MFPTALWSFPCSSFIFLPLQTTSKHENLEKGVDRLLKFLPTVQHKNPSCMYAIATAHYTHVNIIYKPRFCAAHLPKLQTRFDTLNYRLMLANYRA